MSDSDKSVASWHIHYPYYKDAILTKRIGKYTDYATWTWDGESVINLSWEQADNQLVYLVNQLLAGNELTITQMKGS